MSQETNDQRCKRWFAFGMNDKERIDHLMQWVDRLIEQLKTAAPTPDKE